MSCEFSANTTDAAASAPASPATSKGADADFETGVFAFTGTPHPLQRSIDSDLFQPLVNSTSTHRSARNSPHQGSRRSSVHALFVASRTSLAVSSATASPALSSATIGQDSLSDVLRIIIPKLGLVCDVSPPHLGNRTANDSQINPSGAQSTIKTVLNVVALTPQSETAPVANLTVQVAVDFIMPDAAGTNIPFVPGCAMPTALVAVSAADSDQTVSRRATFPSGLPQRAHGSSPPAPRPADSPTTTKLQYYSSTSSQSDNDCDHESANAQEHRRGSERTAPWPTRGDGGRLSEFLQGYLDTQRPAQSSNTQAQEMQSSQLPRLPLQSPGLHTASSRNTVTILMTPAPAVTLPVNAAGTDTVVAAYNAESVRLAERLRATANRRNSLHRLRSVASQVAVAPQYSTHEQRTVVAAAPSSTPLPTRTIGASLLQGSSGPLLHPAPTISTRPAENVISGLPGLERTPSHEAAARYASGLAAAQRPGWALRSLAVAPRNIAASASTHQQQQQPQPLQEQEGDAREQATASGRALRMPDPRNVRRGARLVEAIAAAAGILNAENSFSRRLSGGGEGGESSRLSSLAEAVAAQRRHATQTQALLATLPLETVTVADETALRRQDACCGVCLAAYVRGDIRRCLLPCGHAFHKQCVDKWLWVKIKCPACCGEVTGKTHQ